MQQNKAILTELESGTLIDRCIGLILVTSVTLLESQPILRAFHFGYTELPYRAGLEVISIIFLLMLRDSPLNRSLIDLFSIALFYKLIYLATCFLPSTDAYYFLATHVERPLMPAVMILCMVRILWPSSLPWPALGLHAWQAGDPVWVKSMYPYAAIICATLIGIASPALPNWWGPAFLGSASVLTLFFYARSSDDAVRYVVDKNISNDEKLHLYELGLQESAKLIARLTEKANAKNDEKSDSETPDPEK